MIELSKEEKKQIAINQMEDFIGIRKKHKKEMIQILILQSVVIVMLGVLAGINLRNKHYIPCLAQLICAFFNVFAGTRLIETLMHTNVQIRAANSFIEEVKSGQLDHTF